MNLTECLQNPHSLIFYLFCFLLVVLVRIPAVEEGATCLQLSPWALPSRSWVREGRPPLPEDPTGSICGENYTRPQGPETPKTGPAKRKHYKGKVILNPKTGPVSPGLSCYMKLLGC